MEALGELRQAFELLENPGLIARLSSTLATPIDAGMDMLPEYVRGRILAIAESSLRGALKTALWSLNDPSGPAPSNRIHKAGTALSGAIGGAFGLPALAVELPISTSIMLRSIAEIARSEGEDLAEREAQMACLEVFALGGASKRDDAAETGYFGVRSALAKTVSEAAKYAASTGAIRDSAPALVRLISQIAARFSIPVSEKAAAQSVPVIGAAGGALINVLFMDHFQNAARGHFIVRRLERSHGIEPVQAAYRRLSRES
ncbi:peptidase [Leptolyngbya valderiana BDU 20041]|nr:peptidase [Leptolyngbya valderiana BDU 20041]